MSNDEQFKIIASSALKTLFSSGKVMTPISSFDLLARIITHGPPKTGLLPGLDPPPRFRLTDLARFDEILQRFSEEWDEGKIVLSRDSQVGETTVLDVQLGQTSKGQAAVGGALAHGKKRKRVVDEDADSASGAQEEEEEPSEDMESRKVVRSTLDSLSKEMREVYSLLQRGTAKGRLIAEQVCFRAVHHPRHALTSDAFSSIPQIRASNPFVRISPRRTVSKHAVPHALTPTLPTSSFATAFTSALSSVPTQTRRSATALI
jgi:hypothetical protein